MPEIFPNGMEAVYQKTSLPVVAHNRWWCNETTYSDRNGGSYKVRYIWNSKDFKSFHNLSLLSTILLVLQFHKTIDSGRICSKMLLHGDLKSISKTGSMLKPTI